MRKQLARNTLYGAIALVAFLATSLAIHSLLPPVVPEGVAAKLEFFAQHKDEFDTLVMGTSRLYYSFSPEVFDQTTRENSLPTRTFNFGIDAMHPPENFYVLDQILKAEPRRLKWVFLEAANLETKLSGVFGTVQSLVRSRQSPPGPLFSSNDARPYPMLFDTKVGIDDAHLTREGAEEFTRFLAQEFVRQRRQP